jgi:DNA replication and repair protein RecF
VLKQRNALLKTARLARGNALATLDVWDGHLVDLGGQLLAARLRLVADLAPHMARAYAGVAGADAAVAALGYASTVPLAGDGAPVQEGTALPTADELSAALRERVAERRTDEVDRGMTLVGPHRDDLVISLGSMPAKGFASHGESWSLALALKLGCFALLRADGDEPILVLDDVFATLDADRRAALAAVARSAEQSLVTAAVLDDVPAELRSTVVQVAGGQAVLLEGSSAEEDAEDGGGVREEVR